MRRWLPPLTAAAIAAVLTLSLVAPERLPASLLRLFADGPPRSSAMMVKGGTEIELEIIARPDDPESRERIAKRLAAVGFEIDLVGVDRIFVSLPGYDSTRRRVGGSGVYWPFEIVRVERRQIGYETVDRLDTAHIAAVDIDGDHMTVTIKPELGDWLEAKGGKLALIHRWSRRESAPAVASIGIEIDGQIHFDDVISDAPLAARLVPSEGLIDHGERWDVTPQVSRIHIWTAQAIVATAVGFAVFAIFALAARRRQLSTMVSRDDSGTGRARVAGAALVTVGVIGVGLLRGEPGPFMASIHAGLLGVGIETSALDLGYFAVVCGFVAAMLITLVVPRWRRDLICDSQAGARLLRRGLGLAAVGGALLAIAPEFDQRIDVLLSGWSPGEASLYALTALGLTAAVLAGASRAIGGAWVCVALAVLIPSGAQLGRELLAAQNDGIVGAGTMALAAVLAAAVCAATATVVSRRLGDRDTSLRAPVGGLMPLAVGVGLAVVFAVLTGNLQFDKPIKIQLAVALPLVAAAALFELRLRRGLGGAQVSSLAGRGRRGELTAVGLSLAFTGAILAIDVLARHLDIATFAVLVALTTAALMDVTSELRARWRRPTLTAAWHVHQPQLAGLVERALTSRGLSCHMRGQYLRTCLGIFGAFVPITAMVDRARLAEAREVIESALG